MPLNPPDRLQLLDIVLEVLEAPPGMQPGAGMSYDARIALSLLRLIRRELELGDRLAADETARLAALLDETGATPALNAALCGRLRQRQLDRADPALLQHLRLTTLAKLAIDNPRYSAYQRACARQ